MTRPSIEAAYFLMNAVFRHFGHSKRRTQSDVLGSVIDAANPRGFWQTTHASSLAKAPGSFFGISPSMMIVYLQQEQGGHPCSLDKTAKSEKVPLETGGRGI
jgi:hypothetical protein